MKNLGLTFTSIFYLFIGPGIYLSNNSTIVSSIFIILLLLTLLSIYILRSNINNDINYIKIHPKTLLLFISILVLTFSFTYISNYLLLPNDYVSDNQKILDDALYSNNQLIKSLAFISSIVIAPIMESIIFQYGLQQTLTTKFYSVLHHKVLGSFMATIVTFFVFYLFHSPDVSTESLIYYSFLYFFCLFYALSHNNIFLMIAFHMAWNLL